MSLNTILRTLRVTVILLTLAISGNNVYLPPSTFSDHVNTLLAPTFAIVYAVTLCAKVRLIGPYLRAALLILPALLWYSTSMSRPENRHSNMREPMIRMDTFLSFPASIMIVLECILTLRWEARRKLLVEAAKSGSPHGQRQQQHPSSRQDQELSTMIVIDNRALIPTILPPEEQDNVEVVIPVASTPVIQNCQPSGGSGHLVGSSLVQMPEKVQHAPVRAYFPPASSSASSSSHRGQQRHQRQQRQQRLQRQSDEVHSEEASDDCLPPYTR